MAGRLEARVTKHEREIAAIRKLVMTGMKILVRMEKQTERQFYQLSGEQEAMRKDLRELAASQRETDRMLKGLIRSLERGRNGHGKLR